MSEYTFITLIEHAGTEIEQCRAEMKIGGIHYTEPFGIGGSDAEAMLDLMERVFAEVDKPIFIAKESNGNKWIYDPAEMHLYHVTKNPAAGKEYHYVNNLQAARELLAKNGVLQDKWAWVSVQNPEVSIAGYLEGSGAKSV